MTATAPTTTDQSPPRPDMSAFLMAHRGFRAEFGRLATASRQVRDERHAALIDDQIDLVMHLLHHHHTAEDTSVWPTLVARVPAAQPVLARLEGQHEDMDPLFAAVTDTSVPVADRADAMQRLHEMLNDHLDEEEREAIPLIVSHYSKEEWDAGGEEVLATLDRKRLPLIFGWLDSVSTPEQRTGALAEIPLLPRVLFRLLWGPQYRKRFTALYGDLRPGPSPRRVLS